MAAALRVSWLRRVFAENLGDMVTSRRTGNALNCTMTKKLLFVTTILLVVVCVAFAADITGKWTYSTPGRNGGPDRQVTITLKDNGDGTLAGSVPAMGGGRRGGGGGGGDAAAPPPEAQITAGKIAKDGSFSFEVHSQGRNGETVTKYEGTVSGDSMKLKVTRPNMQGGDPNVQEYTANRSKT